jgi:enolase
MIILRESEQQQQLKVILKGGLGDTIVIKDDETNIDISQAVEFFKKSYYQICSLIFDLKENKYYTITIFYKNQIIYSDKLFCTNQEIKDYTINKDTYNEPTTETKYTIFE